jgi:hypothetical protein
MSIPRFTMLFFLYSLVVVAIPPGLEGRVSFPVVSDHYPLLSFFLFFLTLIVYVLSYLGIKKGGQISVLSLLGGLTMKMIFSLSLMLVLILKTADNQKVLAGNFFYLYFLFTVFEVTCLLRNLRDQNKT